MHFSKKDHQDLNDVRRQYKMELLEIFQRGLVKVDYMEEMLNGEFPHITKNKQWLTNANGHWTGGFWTGLLWMKGLYTEDSDERLNQFNIANNQAKKLSVRMSDNKTHDQGFIFGPSCVLGNHIQSDERLVEMAIAGAHNMKDLFEEKTGLVLAWDEPGYEGVAIVDTIMNAPLLIWASKEEKNEELYEIGIKLADSIRKNHIRDDYSIYHVVRWDPDTYEVVERTTHQGYSPNSCWSRGQAWALYGFANMYRYTSKEDYLEVSKNLAQYFWEHLDDNLLLPRWDFIFKNNHEEPLDASAASIAASGMLLLSKMLELQKNRVEAEKWKERGKRLIKAIQEHCYYKSLDEYGLIENVTVDKPRNSGVNESSMYGDYYFMEAVYRYINFDSIEKTNLLY